MASCPHCGDPLELSVTPADVTVHDGDASQTIQPDVFECHSCGSVLFATVSSEMEDG
jgi:hypothetical protein